MKTKTTPYWEECISCSLDEIGVVLTDEQIKHLASDVEGAHENYGMYSGNDVASSNLRSAKEREMEALHDKLKKERDKITCRTCNGTGELRSDGPAHYSLSRCWKCNGEGRHAP